MRQVIGACLLTLLDVAWWVYLAAVPLHHLAWQIDNGWRGEWVRGARNPLKAWQWATIQALALVIPLIYFVPTIWVLWPAYLIGITITMFIAVQLPALPMLDLKHAWPWSELLEFMLIIPLVCLIVIVTGKHQG